MTSADPTLSLPFAWGGPVLTGLVRQSPDDFQVVEELGYAPSGAGEHAFLVIRKRGRNTEDVARDLARCAGVRRLAVGYAGRKDRRAVTTQAFTIQLPGRDMPDWSRLEDESLQVLCALRHGRKIRRGGLRGNRFELRLRAVRGDRALVDALLSRVCAEGVPNYFGPQRFGWQGGNLTRVDDLFAGRGRAPARDQRGLLLSAARAQLFNLVLAERVPDGSWAAGLPGDVLQPADSHGQFPAGFLDPELRARLTAGAVHATGPLYGRSSRALSPEGAAAALEERVAGQHAAWIRGLMDHRLDADRRALRLLPRDLRWDWEDDCLAVRFALPAGAYATTVVRELIDSATATRES